MFLVFFKVDMETPLAGRGEGLTHDKGCMT